MHGLPSLLHNCASTAGHSLLLQLAGATSNRSALGARVTIHLGARRLVDEVRSGGSFGSQNDLRLHVGLGRHTRVDRVEVIWPNGAAETLPGLDADQIVVIREGAGVVRREPLSERPAALCGTAGPALVAPSKRE